MEDDFAVNDDLYQIFVSCNLLLIILRMKHSNRHPHHPFHSLYRKILQTNIKWWAFSPPPPLLWWLPKEGRTESGRRGSKRKNDERLIIKKILKTKNGSLKMVKNGKIIIMAEQMSEQTIHALAIFCALKEKGNKWHSLSPSWPLFLTSSSF